MLTCALLSVQEGSFEKIVKALDGPTLVRKGTVDTISDGETTLVCDEPGSNRRAGGQVSPHLIRGITYITCVTARMGVWLWGDMGNLARWVG